MYYYYYYYPFTLVFPSTFRQARITPLLKKPTHIPSLLEIYRPVSLSLQKTLEQAVFNQFSAFLTQNNLLDSNQSSFRSGHLTKTILLSVVKALKLARADSKSSILRSFKVSWRGEVSKSQTTNCWGASGLSSWTTSLFCLHDITRFCRSETWLFISLLCWWHSTLPLIPFWW